MKATGFTVSSHHRGSSIPALPIVVLAILLTSLAVTAEPVSAAGTLSLMSGTVTIKRPGAGTIMPDARGTEVLAGDAVGTGDGATAQITFADGAFINLFPRTTVRINQYAFDPALVRRTARVRLLAGRVRFVQYKPLSIDSAFYLETDTAMIIPGVKGDMGAAVGPSGTSVTALGSSVRVTNSSGLVVGEVNLGPNQRTLVREKLPPEQPTTLPADERKEYMRDLRRPVK